MQEATSTPATPSSFNFSPDQIHTDHITSTLKDLLVEINLEEKAGENSIHGREITLSSLKATRTFLSGLTGRAYASIAEPLPEDRQAALLPQPGSWRSHLRVSM